MPPENPLRVFLALDPPPEVQRRITAIQGDLKRVVRGDIAWVRPEGIHLTLKFFGYVAPADVERISRAIGESLRGASALTLTVRGIGVFPGPRRPRVIWLGTEGDVEPLCALQAKLEEGLTAIGFPAEQRPFRAHLTLARIRSPQGLTGLEKAVAEGEQLAAGTFRAAVLALFRSELHPTGARYTRLAEFPLGGGGEEPPRQ
jgi:RNA 2',3'-cyclic 3'-phosphodiesterase